MVRRSQIAAHGDPDPGIELQAHGGRPEDVAGAGERAGDASGDRDVFSIAVDLEGLERPAGLLLGVQR